jgi:hypothetical protein
MHRPGSLTLGLDPRVFAIARSSRRWQPSLVLALGLFAVADRSLAEQLSDRPSNNMQLPSAPEAQSVVPTPPATPALVVPPTPIAVAGTVSGTVTDSDGASIAGAKVTLTRDGAPPEETRVAVTTDDGRFSFANASPGPFKISITATGFTAQQSSGQINAGEGSDLPAIVLGAASSTSISVTATQADIAEAQVKEEEKQRVIGVFPNFYVSYIPNPVPLNPKQKFELAFRTMIDPVSFALNGITAGAEQADNVYAWGQGAQGYGKRYAASYGTFLTGTLIGSAALPVLFKQDPRYFYKGTGSIHSRVLYALAMAVMTKGDNHRWQVDYSAILGGLAASGISNAYYPAVNRSGARLIFEGTAIGTGVSGLSNLIQEFIVRRLTPHIPPPPPANP